MPITRKKKSGTKGLTRSVWRSFRSVDRPVRRMYLIRINLFMRSHGPILILTSAWESYLFLLIYCVYMCVFACIFTYAHTSVFFHCISFTFFFLFSGDNMLPKAIDTLMRCYQGFSVAINFIFRMLVLRACFRDNLFFFLRCAPYTYI
jgi:hypothetical protein